MASLMETVQEIKQAKRDAHTDGLRQIADFLDMHPEVPRPYHLLDGKYYIYLHGDDQRAQLATIARAMGRAEKSVEGERFYVSRPFGGITLIAQADRAQVCERVVVGTREVEVEEADPAAVAALPKVKHVKVIEDVEWVCSPALLADDTSDSAAVQS
jgi:hypothetical protein